MELPALKHGGEQEKRQPKKGEEKVTLNIGVVMRRK